MWKATGHLPELHGSRPARLAVISAKCRSLGEPSARYRSSQRRRLLVLRRRDWQICDEQVDTDGILAVPLKPCGVLFFDALLPRGTPPPIGRDS